MGILGSVIGLVLGVVVVRAFFFDGLEELGWRMFWSEVRSGRANLASVASSATFLKCVVGAITGAALGGVIGERMTGKPGPTQQANPDHDDTMKCPFCAETIKKEAIVCKHCGRSLADGAQ